MRKLKELWEAETPKIARFLQLLSGALVTLPIYFNTLPDDFKSSIPTSILTTISIGGGIVTLLLQLTTKKTA